MTLSSHTPFPNLFSVHYKFPENEAILRKLIILDKLVFNILECLMNNIEKRIDIYVEESGKLEWGKPLKNMPLFTIKEIELHRKSSSKIPGLAIVKILDGGKKFKEERYIC